MAVPDGGVTRWFRDSNGRISQINNVVEITFGSPLVAQGYYRDSPPVVVGGIAAYDSVDEQSVAVAGGVDPTATGFTDYVSANTTAKEDDAYTHVEPRVLYFPVPMVFFRTVDDLTPTNPDTNTFEILSPPERTPAKDEFDTFNMDCCFAWGDDCAIWNVPPPGWSVGESS